MRVVLSLLLALTVSVGGAVAQTPAPVNLAFATLDTGSAWYVYGATMAELLRKTLPPGSNIDVKPRSGGVGNPRLVAKNETPLGLAFTVTNRWAHEGKEAYTEKLENIRAFVKGLAQGTGIADADEFSYQWQLLMNGAIGMALDGDRGAARHAKELGLLLLEREVAP